MKDSFVLYTEYREQIEMLDMAQRGELLTAILCHASGQDVQIADGMVAMAYAFISARMDRDAEKYEETCRARREAGQLGGRPQKPKKPNGSDEKPKKPNGFSENQTKAKKPDNDTDNDTEHENDNEKIKEIYPCGDVVDYLNQKLGTRYRASTKDIRKHIIARFRDGATLEDFKTVIDKKTAEWQGTEWAKFLRPRTLFGPKFETYLNQLDAPKTHTARTKFDNFTASGTNWDAVTQQIMSKQGG